MPAVSLETAVLFVAAAYIVFMGLLLVYVAIIARKMGRMERELVELEEPGPGAGGDRDR